MKKLRNFIILIVLLAIAAMVFFMFYNGKLSSIQSAGVPQKGLVGQGEYLARAGDCFACHTADKGQFAGGLPMESGTPVGIIYSTNITPDKATGIGDYTLQDFDNAVRYGVRKDGKSLYPAMPYPSFTVTTDQDIEALYAYFMHSVQPINNANRPVSASWPFSVRWPLNAWRLMFAPQVSPFIPPANASEEMARGAYLVEGLGHCGACHTPRNMTMVEKAFNNNSKDFLSGGQPMEGWHAINLRGDYIDGLGSFSDEQLFMLLKTGRNDTSTVYGSMSEVVQESLQYLSDDDLKAIVIYLKSLSPVSSDNQPFVYDSTVYTALYNGDASKQGAMTYMDHCAACHRTDGKGYAQTFPALSGNPSVQSPDPSSIISIVLRGSTIHGTKATPTAYTMPGYAWRLNDKEVADVVNFIRTSWGNNAATVKPEQVKELRKYVTPEMVKYQTMQTNPVTSYDEK